MKIDHIGYAVKDINRAKESFEILGFQFGDAIEDPDRNIKISFGEKDGYRIELVQPLDGDISSPVDTYLSNVGPTPYHFCYISDFFTDDIIKLQEKKFKIVSDPQPAVAFCNHKVIFMMNLGIGLIEIVENGEVND